MRAFVFLRTAPRRPGTSISGTRWRIDGAAQVQVLQALSEGRYSVLLTHVSGPDHRKGETVELHRDELYVGPAERAYFEQLVSYTFGGSAPTPHPGERPPAEPAELLSKPRRITPRRPELEGPPPPWAFCVRVNGRAHERHTSNWCEPCGEYHPI
jgi:hypothetical protein